MNARVPPLRRLSICLFSSRGQSDLLQTEHIDVARGCEENVR